MKTIFTVLFLAFTLIGNVYAVTISSDSLAACGYMGGDPSVRLECLESDVPAQVVYACKTATVSDELRIACLHSQMEPEAIHACRAMIAVDEVRRACFKSRKSAEQIMDCKRGARGDANFSIRCLNKK